MHVLCRIITNNIFIYFYRNKYSKISYARMAGFLLFIFIIFMVKADEVDVKFIGDYFESRGISLIAAFGCWNIFGT